MGGYLTLVILVFAALTIIYRIYPEYYALTSIGIVKIPFFFVGMWAGQQATEKKELNIYWIIFLFICYVCLFIWPIMPWLKLREDLLRILGIVFCSSILLFTDKYKARPHFILRWLGEYSLEIYILHLMFMSLFQPEDDMGYWSTFLAVGCALILCKPFHLLCNNISHYRIF